MMITLSSFRNRDMCFLNVFYSTEGLDTHTAYVISIDGYFKDCFERSTDAIAGEGLWVNYEGSSSFRGNLTHDECFV